MELFVKGLVVGEKWTKHKRLEEPGGVSLMPFHRTGLRARLHHLILRRQTGGERSRHRPHGSKFRSKTRHEAPPVPRLRRPWSLTTRPGANKTGLLQSNQPAKNCGIDPRSEVWARLFAY